MSLKAQTLQAQIKFGLSELSRDLGDGLVMRLATSDDIEPLAQFNGWVHGRDHFEEFAAAYTRDYMSATHPVIGPANVMIVEDTRARKIVSTMILIPQTWTYAGIPFGVGRPEMVGTDAAYRQRGLVRAQFDVLHALSAAMGHRAQGITGIPWFYRQFEYEYALDFGGGRMLMFDAIPALKTGESEPYRLRAMTLDDIPFAAPLYDRDCARSLVACPRPEWVWRHLLVGNSPASFENRPFQIIETRESRAVGYLAPSREVWNETLYLVTELAMRDGQSIRAAMPAVLRALKAMGEAEGARQNKKVNSILLNLGRVHPVYDAIFDLPMRTRIPYGWYIRVADVPAFINHIAPALEARLARSSFAGHTGEIKITEYRKGMRLIFENGKIRAESWDWIPHAEDAGFPPWVFLQLLFGRHAMAELREIYPDAWAKDEAWLLLDAVFPKQSSCVMPVG